MRFDYLGVGLYWQPVSGNNIDQVSAHSYRYVNVIKDKDNQFKQTSIIIDLGKYDNFTAFDVEGASAAVPDIRFMLDGIEENRADALLLTHSHPDHINSIPHYVKLGYKLPKIYSGKFTLIILKDLLKNYGIKEKDFPEMIEVKAGDKFDIGSMNIKVLNSSHTSLDSFGYIISSNHGRIYHGGDMKVDKSIYFNEGSTLEYLSNSVKDNKIDAFVADLVGTCNKGHTYKEKDTFKSLYNQINKNKDKHRIFLPVYPTHQEIYILAFLAALKAGKDVLFYGDSNFYSYLKSLQEYGFDFEEMAKDKIKLFYGNNLKNRFDEIKEGIVIIGTYNDISGFKSINKKNSFGIITAWSYFNPLKGYLILNDIKYIGVDTNPELQGHGHAYLDEFISISKALDNPIVLGTHVPEFFISAFNRIAPQLGINVTKDIPRNGSIFKIIDGKIESIGILKTYWLVISYENNEIVSYRTVNQKATSGKGYLKRTLSKRKTELFFKIYEKNNCDKISA